MIEDDALFPFVATAKLRKGQPVTVQTMWGDESGMVLDLMLNKGWPMAEVLMINGDTISIDVARVRPRDAE